MTRRALAILGLSLCLSMGGHGRSFEPAAKSNRPRFPEYREPMSMPVDGLLLDRSVAAKPGRLSPAGDWVMNTTALGESLTLREANAVGKRLLKRLMDAPDRVSTPWKTDQGMGFTIQSAELGVEAHFHAGQFHSFSLLNDGAPANFSTIGHLVAQGPTGAPPTRAQSEAYKSVYLDAVLDSPGRMDTLSTLDGEPILRVRSPEMGVDADISPSGNIILVHGPERPEMVLPVPRQLALEFKSRVSGALEFKGSYSRERLGHLKGFEADAPALVQKQGLTMDEFERWFAEPAILVPRSVIPKLKAIREAVPMPTKDTLLQKVIPYGQVEKYLNGDFTRIKGFVMRAEDVIDLTDFRKTYNSLRLDYDGSQFNDVSDRYLGVIRFKTPSVDKIEVPFSKEFGGNHINGYPFTGNGFVSTGNGKIRPEFKIIGKDGARIMNGAELYIIDRAGNEQLDAVFDVNKSKFIRR
ncbi:MAG: hypothetical protein IPI26_08270 [Elusimicrobia bacterium]|jgi:hypothetical protein|nr:hypothetical protein [Elusimicrobiota bacterium]MBK7545576.1 hypothetical protein [Elusimicrobiota bacterium]MBK7575233.1 hypothetical protein [Elusimicrobiota bacterium]MBL0249915.1 hypothetical protein [Elusimicrobiota bacterium]